MTHSELQRFEIRGCQAVQVMPDGTCCIGVRDVVREDEKGQHVLMSHQSTKRTRKIYWATERHHERTVPTCSDSTLLQARPPTGSNYRPLLTGAHPERFGYSESALLWVDVPSLSFPWEPMDSAFEITSRPAFDDLYFDFPKLMMQVGINGFPTTVLNWQEGNAWRRDDIIGLHAYGQVPLIQMHYFTDLNQDHTLICDHAGAMLSISLEKGVLVSRPVTRDLFIEGLKEHKFGCSVYYYKVQRKMLELMG